MKLSILVAYPYFTRDVRDALDRQDPATFRIMVDSGAFTAWTLGRPVDINEYGKFLRALPRDWSRWAIQLDVIGDPEGTKRNLEVMLDAGHERLLGVYTRGMTFEDREWLYERVPYVAVGGIVGNRQYVPHVRRFLATNDHRPVHLLGYAIMRDIRQHRPRSVDASSWKSARRFGMIHYPAGAPGSGNLLMLAKDKFARHPGRACVDGLRRLGLTTREIAALGRKTAWRGAMPDSGRSVPQPGGTGWADFVGTCAHVYRSITVEQSLGTRIYFATTTAADVASLFTAYRFMKQRGAL